MLRKGSRLALLGALMLVVAMLLASCGGGKPAQEQPPAPAKEKVITVAMWGPPNNFSPINTDSDYGYYPVNFMFDTLVSLDKDFNFVGRLAEKWEESPDGRTFTFHINPKANWHDGKPVTSDDILFTLNLITDPTVQTNRGAYVSYIEGTDENGKRNGGELTGFKKIDDKTFSITTKTPVDKLMLFEMMGCQVWYLPKHVLENVPPADLAKDPFFQKPTVGNGPFKFVQYATDQYVELARNDDYYLGKPKVDKIFVRIVTPATTVAELEKGTIDLTAMAGISGIPLQDWERVKSLTNVESFSFPTTNYQYIEINHRKAYLHNDVRVRQALVYAINRQMLVDQLLKGTGSVCNAPVPPMGKYFDKDLKGYPYDPEKAKELLKAAGWDNNRELKVLVPIGNKVREQSADIIVQNFAAVGVKAKIQKMDFPTMMATLKTDNWDLAFIGWGGNMDPDVRSQYRTGGEYNDMKYSSKKMDQLLDQGASEPDFQKRFEIYKQVQQLFVDDVPVIFLYWQDGTGAVSKRVTGVNIIGAQYPNWDAYLWDIKE